MVSFIVKTWEPTNKPLKKITLLVFKQQGYRTKMINSEHG